MEKGDEQNQAAWWHPAVMMFAKLSGWIAAPVIIALYLGKWLDKRYDSAPWLLLGCIGVAFFVSMIGLVKETVREYKKIDHLGKSGKTDKKL
ncbi:MAG: AtpZ/AtpI family protein [Candidatus Falkowbacteria bacterium]